MVRSLPALLSAVWFAGVVFLACASPSPRAPEPPAPSAAPSAGVAPVLVATSNEDAAPEHHDAAVPVTSADPQWGEPLAPVTIVEFGDFQCPFCARVAESLEQVRQTYGPSKVRIVWKNNPLPFHKQARATADAAQIVFAYGGSTAFFRFHDRALANQYVLTPENHERWAREAGIDLARFREAVASKRHTEKVDDDIALAQRVGATGTPAFRINGITLSGAQPFDKFREVIDAELVEAKKLVDAGTSRRDVYVTRTNRNFVPPSPAKTADTTPDLVEDLAVWKIPVSRDDPVRGPRDALVTIVEFSEFQCPFCKRVEETLEAVVRAHPNDVRLVWKDNPLPFHPRAKATAILARAAFEKRGNEAFWKVHAALFASQPKLEDDDLRPIAEGAKLAWEPLAAAFDKDFPAKIAQSMDLATDFHVRGTPHFFINGVRLAGAQPREKFEARIAEALEVARELVAKGVRRAAVYDTIIAHGKLPEPPEQKTIAPPDATTPFRGSASAPVVIQEFSDFQCPFCKRVTPTLAELEATFGAKVKIVWRHFPLPFHKDAPLAAEAAHEAFVQRGNAGFWRFHDALFEAQENGIGRETLEAIAERLGLDRGRFRAALDARKHRAKVEADTKIAVDAGINGTPAFVINGYFVSGAQPATTFKKWIRRALDEKKKR
jgi:protein-disulfide isomerase